MTIQVELDNNNLTLDDIGHLRKAMSKEIMSSVHHIALGLLVESIAVTFGEFIPNKPLKGSK